MMNMLEHGDICIFSPAGLPESDAERILLAFPDAAFLWVENPGADFRSLRLHGICCRKKDGKLISQRTFGFIFGEYFLDIRPGCVIAPGPGGQGFSIGGGRVSFNHAGYRLACLDVTLAPSGQFSFRTGPVADKNIFEKLGAGIRYSTANNDADCDNTVDSIRSVVLYPKGELSFSARLDPLNIRDGGRSFLQIPAQREFSSSFISVSGSPLSLFSRGDSRLVFQLAPCYIHDGTALNTTLALGFSGGFDLPGNEPVLCGLSGTEYFRGENPTVFFQTGGGFVDAEHGLTAQCETSHISMSPNTTYYSQPQAAPFFAPSGQGLRFLPMPQYTMGGDDKIYVPMMPYNNAAASFADSGQCRRLEEALLKSRHETFAVRVAEPRLRLAASGAPHAVSTQGLFIWLSGDEWEAIGFAKTGGTYLRFTNISPQMRGQYQASNVFIIYDQSNPLPGNAAGEDFALTLAGFSFALRPDWWRGGGTGTDTVMMVKYRTDKSIAELAAGHSVLQASIAACNDADHNPRDEFADFLKIINDKNFQGVLFLNPKVEITDSIDAGLRTVLSGLGDDINGLYAHNLVFPKSKVSVERGAIEIGESLFAATIDYKGKTRLGFDPNQNNPPEADFKTVSFLADIAESELKAVQSESELLINKLFGGAVSKTSEGGNCLIIDGRLVMQGEQSLFKYRLRGGGVYTLKGKLRHVSVTDISLSADAGGQARLTLGGRLYFGVQAGGDLFSYGLAADDDYAAGGLVYGNILVRKQAARFMVDYAGLHFDPVASAARENSMAARFPYHLEAYSSSEKTGGKSPAESGYINIQSPEQQSALPQEWHGLLWRVPLGSLGDLSSGSVLDIQVLTAWGPESGCFIGVKLPFGAGGLDVQGLLKLGFKAIEIKAETKEIEKDKKRTDFSMVLTQFTVTLLSLSFPPGNNKIFITANEAGNKLGWFAGYAEEKPKGE